MSQLEKDRRVNITFHYHTEILLKTIDALFIKLLAKIDMVYLLDSIVTILREIIANAVKANAKRYYFKKINIDINKPESYADGIKDFRISTIGNSTIEKELEKTDYMVVLSIVMDADRINISVENNTSIHPEELKRISLRVSKAAEYKDFTDAYDDIYDETEGAGLGIVLTILLLKNTGMGEKYFSIRSDGKATRAQFAIPYELKPKAIITKIQEQIILEIDGLPSFNTNIMELLRMCKDPDSTIDRIVEKIRLDPSLTSDILKLSNSAGFFVSRRVEQINEAIMIIGLTNLYDLLLVSGTRSIMEKRYSKFQEIWNHCNRTAAYAGQIARKFSRGKSIEFAYLGGLLHDLGKIVLLSTNSKFTSWISDLTKDRKIRNSTVLEEVSLGISHSTIGELIAKKWNFPGYLIDTIKYHHSPMSAPDKFKDFIWPVYMANMLCGFENGKYQYFYLDQEILEKFELHSAEEVADLHKELKEIYK